MDFSPLVVLILLGGGLTVSPLYQQAGNWFPAERYYSRALASEEMNSGVTAEILYLVCTTRG